MFLRPHHFQQMERYLARQAKIQADCHAGIYWGFCTLKLDQDALATGSLALLEASGIFPDGTPFSFTRAQDGPAALHIPAGTQGRKFVLALPRRRDGEHEISFEQDDSSLARYSVVEEEVQDSCTVSLEPVVLQLGRLRLRLMPEDEAGGDWVTLGVARVAERLNNQQIALDSDYIAPVLGVGADAVLMSRLSEVIALLQARGTVLAERLSRPGRGGVSEVSEFLMLATINRYRGVMEHIRQTSVHHPERLFHDLLMLAGDLETFSASDRRLAAFPEYVHDDLAASFHPLVLRIRHALSVVLEDSALQIPLEDKGQGVRVCHVNDPAMRRTSALILAAHADMPADTLRARFPAQAKLGPIERIRDLVHLQLPGIGIRPMLNTPRQIPYHAGYIYFELEKTGEMWKQFQNTGGLALHLSGDFPGLELEFWALRSGWGE
jgi:type VI secretion system protein ImpJ